MASYPALRIVGGDGDRVLAIVDDYSPTAVDEDEQDAALRVFFSTSSARDAAQAALAGSGITAEHIDVDDEDWARRSQEKLAPITSAASRSPRVIRVPLVSIHNPQSEIRIVITERHHATTRLARGLRTTIAGASVLDVRRDWLGFARRPG